jgi:hypothetical protein
MGHFMDADDVVRQQRLICAKFDAAYAVASDYSKIGISKNFDPQEFPINGLRHPPEGDTTGWYIWSGAEFSQDKEFFIPLHVSHLAERCPMVLQYLGLAPGWRFLITADHEDVWQDKSLLQT